MVASGVITVVIASPEATKHSRHLRRDTPPRDSATAAALTSPRPKAERTYGDQ